MLTAGADRDRARQPAYLLYQEANADNSLITAWPSLREGARAAAARAAAPVEQTPL
ncbi:MAG: hypothetical protein OXM54_00585 [Acidimicrobiaceae bacterium]|nr:hypothetical protein [Acidimicrobiaceae bacterium]